MTLLVPSTAGLMSSFSSFGTPGGIGEATCITLSTPFKAESHDYGLSKSASLNSRCYFALRS